MTNKGRRDSFSDEDAEMNGKLEQNEIDDMFSGVATHQRERSMRSKRESSREEEQKARYGV